VQREEEVGKCFDMKGQKTLFSKKSDDWATPQNLYALLDSEFGFDFDPCPLNRTFDGLEVNWGKRNFVNPPYSNQRAFIEKGNLELMRGNAELNVYLLPARTDTKLFHELIYGKSEIRFLRGRLKFGDSKNSAPFPSMVCVMRK
jgi:site-specific DNA-methyltransferase (adenine-specific)